METLDVAFGFLSLTDGNFRLNHKFEKFYAQPTFPKNDHPSQNEAKLKMEVKLEFKSSHSWIKTPKKLHLNSGGRSFGFHVDPTYIDPGAYFGRINAYDVENAALGPLFSIPIAVCKPEPYVILKYRGYQN